MVYSLFSISLFTCMPLFQTFTLLITQNKKIYNQPLKEKREGEG